MSSKVMIIPAQLGFRAVFWPNTLEKLRPADFWFMPIIAWKIELCDEDGVDIPFDSIDAWPIFYDDTPPLNQMAIVDPGGSQYIRPYVGRYDTLGDLIDSLNEGKEV